MKTRLPIACAVLLLAIASVSAQEQSGDARERARANFARPIVLAEDDVRLFP